MQVRADLLWEQLRTLQRKTFCSTSTLRSFANAACPGANIRSVQRRVDKKMTERATAVVLKLHGCKWCDHYVFLPSNPARRCPECQGERYDDAGKPYEVCIFFPLEPQLRALLGVENFRRCLQHEYKRPCHRLYMTDVYDSPMWRRLFGPARRHGLRVVLQLAVDGIPAFDCVSSGLSLKPWGYMILGLSPKMRVQSDNMLLQMLIPSELKGQSAKKYYDFVAAYEMNRLYTSGIDGIRVMTFGTTLDTPGRRELLQLQVRCTIINSRLKRLIRD